MNIITRLVEKAVVVIQQWRWVSVFLTLIFICAILFLISCTGVAKQERLAALDAATEITRQECYNARAVASQRLIGLSGTDLALTIMGNALVERDSEPCRGSTNSADLEIARSQEATKKVTGFLGIFSRLITWGAGAVIADKTIDALADRSDIRAVAEAGINKETTVTAPSVAVDGLVTEAEADRRAVAAAEAATTLATDEATAEAARVAAEAARVASAALLQAYIDCLRDAATDEIRAACVAPE